MSRHRNADLDHFEIVRNLVWRCFRFLSELRKAQNGLQRIVDLMGHATCQPTHGRHLFELRFFFFKGQTLRDVTVHTEMRRILVLENK